jgi:hypothetical protein
VAGEQGDDPQPGQGVSRRLPVAPVAVEWGRPGERDRGRTIWS